MTEHRPAGPDHGGIDGEAPGPFITIPALARDEIGQLAFYIEQMLHNLREVNDHVRGSSLTMPGVLHDLRDVVKMTEAATVKVLEETEALIEEGRAASALVAEARKEVGSSAAERVSDPLTPLTKLQLLVDTVNERALSIMCALEFQDLTSQKVQHAFGVLEEVAVRLSKIQTLVDLGQRVGAPAPPARLEVAAGGKSGQDLVDELLLGFQP